LAFGTGENIPKEAVNEEATATATAGQAGAAGAVNENAEAEDLKADETNVERKKTVTAKEAKAIKVGRVSRGDALKATTPS
jgi:hypothetical protein